MEEPPSLLHLPPPPPCATSTPRKPLDPPRKSPRHHSRCGKSTDTKTKDRSLLILPWSCEVPGARCLDPPIKWYSPVTRSPCAPFTAADSGQPEGPTCGQSALYHKTDCRMNFYRAAPLLAALGKFPPRYYVFFICTTAAQQVVAPVNASLTADAILAKVLMLRFWRLSFLTAKSDRGMRETWDRV